MSLTKKLNKLLDPDEVSIFGYICHEGEATLNNWAYCTELVQAKLDSLEQRGLIRKDKSGFYRPSPYNSDNF